MKFFRSSLLLALLVLMALTTWDRAQTATPNPSPGVPGTGPASTVVNDSSVGEDIRDIRGPISIPYPWLWALYVAGGLLTAGVVYWLWETFRRRPMAPPKDAFQIALEKLEAAKTLMVPERAREYSFAVSEITRAYIEQRFEQRAIRGTTEEFLYGLLAQIGTPLSAHRSLLEDFLQHCDLAKFAGWQLSDAEMASMHESAHSFILATRPLPERETKNAPRSRTPELKVP